MNQLPENSLRIYDVTLVTSYLIGLSSDLNTLKPSQAPGGYIHRCYQTIFPGAHKVETVLSQVLILRLSEPRPTLGKQLAQGR